MRSLNSIFDRYLEETASTQNNITLENLNETGIESDVKDSLPSTTHEEFELQSQIRPLYGKEGVNSSLIGTHPDFIHLEGTEGGTLNHYTCTLFVDIISSTRLSLLYDLHIVYQIKNVIIKTCIEIIRSLDGHVHRIMGDAVMGFFGGSGVDKENAIADALNCSITLKAILEEHIKPWLEKKGYIEAKDFGFRVGIDFGNDDEVLWGKFGYTTVGEVSATGLPVDMASKLQGLAGKNNTMLGQGLLNFVDWPDEYSIIKTKIENGLPQTLPIVTPNITDADMNPINYKMRKINYTKYLRFSALPRDFREKIDGTGVIDNPAIDYVCYTINDDQKKQYISASKYLSKGISLKFVVNIKGNFKLAFPLTVTFVKTNHGFEADQNDQAKEFPAVTKEIRSFVLGTETIDEGTEFRGLHTMKCEVFDAKRTRIFCDWIGVMIK